MDISTIIEALENQKAKVDTSTPEGLIEVGAYNNALNLLGLVTSDKAKARVWDEAVNSACASCMVDIECETPRSVYSRLSGPVKRKLLEENPYREKEDGTS